MELSVIIVTWNSESFIKNCLTSLLPEIQNLKSEIIVIDNNSKDKTVQIVKKQFPEVKLIKNKINLGFGAANNQGIKKARGKYLLLLNPDTLVHKKTINPMLLYLEKNPKVGLVGPDQLGGSGGPTYNISRNTIRGVFEYLLEKLLSQSILTGVFKTPYEVDRLNAGCWLMKKEIFKKTGLFNEDLFLYGEEEYICSRIRKSGLKIIFLRNLTITHFRQGSVKQIGWQKHLHVLKSFSRVYILNRFAPWGTP